MGETFFQKMCWIITYGILISLLHFFCFLFFVFCFLYASLHKCEIFVPVIPNWDNLHCQPWNVRVSPLRQLSIDHIRRSKDGQKEFIKKGDCLVEGHVSRLPESIYIASEWPIRAKEYLGACRGRETVS